MLVRQGYNTNKAGVDAAVEDDEGPLWSVKLIGFHDTRVVLWEEKDEWKAVMVMGVGMSGWYPLVERAIRRYPKSRPFPKANVMKAEAAGAQEEIRSWYQRPFMPHGMKAIIALMDYFLTKKKPNQAMRLGRIVLNGELNLAPISFGLSLVQEKVAKSREERLRSALIWRDVFGASR